MASSSPWRYLLVDVDGTLLDSQGRISPRSRAALHEAVAAGLTLVLASGRTYVSLLRVTDGLDLPFHMITNGGAVGLAAGRSAGLTSGPAANRAAPDPGAIASPAAGPGAAGDPAAGDPGPGSAVAESAAVRTVPYLSVLPPAVWPRVVEGLRAEGLSAAVFGHRNPGQPDPPRVFVASERGDPHFEAYVSRNRALVRVAPDLAAAAIPEVVEVAALGEGAAFDHASARVRARFAEETESHTMVLVIAARFGKITEFFRRGTSKWNAFLGLFPEAARHPETVIAVGDEANDREMIARAGLGIAMGNATDELKALARRVTADHDRDGLALALEPILAALRTGGGEGAG